MNKVILIGNLGKDPEVRSVAGGKSVANFSIATTEKYKDKGGETITNTEWHNIVAWSPLAELCDKYLKKGSKIALDGKIQTRSWDDKDGQKKYTTEIVMKNMEFLGGKESSGQPQESRKAQEAVPVDDESNDLPF